MAGISVYPPTIYRQAPQAGTVTIAANATTGDSSAFTAVGPKGYVEFNGHIVNSTGGGSTLNDTGQASIKLQTTTTVRATRAISDPFTTVTVYFTVLDPY